MRLFRRKKEMKEGDEENSYFSFNSHDHISIPRIGEVKTVPARIDGTLDVQLEFLPTYVVIHLFFSDTRQVNHNWGRYNTMGQNGNPHDQKMRHTVKIIPFENKHNIDEYTGTIPGTDMFFDYTRTAHGHRVMRLYGPNKTWFLRWNDVRTNNEVETAPIALSNTELR